MSQQIDTNAVSEEISVEELRAVFGGKEDKCIVEDDGKKPPPNPPEDGSSGGGTGVPGT
jgi:hypothetical protein